MEDGNRCIRLLVVGDSGVGKTSFVHAFCNKEVPKDPYATVGCNIDVKLHEYNNQTWEVELWDIGGSPSHRGCRSVFYENIHGIILVHDITNRKSYNNLNKWINEIVSALSSEGSSYDKGGEPSYTRSSHTASRTSNDFIDLEEFVGDANLVPMVMVGTKRDEAAVVDHGRGLDTTGILVSTQYMSDFEMSSAGARQLAKFLDSCIQRWTSQLNFSGHRSLSHGFGSTGTIARNYSNSHLSGSHLAPGLDHLMPCRPGLGGPYERRRKLGNEGDGIGKGIGVSPNFRRNFVNRQHPL
eukprot:CFRG7084T1